MRTTLGVVVVSLLVLIPTVALAQEPGRARPAREGRQIDGRTVYEWTDADAVEGARGIPFGDVIAPRGRARRARLIRIRENFVPEALKSVENL